MSDTTTYSYQYWGGTFAFLMCNTCGNVLARDYHSNYRSIKPPKFCANCGRSVGKREKISDTRAAKLVMMARERAI